MCGRYEFSELMGRPAIAVKSCVFGVRAGSGSCRNIRGALTLRMLRDRK